MGHRLEPQQLSTLIPAVLPMLTFVHKKEPLAGDCFLGKALDVLDDDVHIALSDVLKLFKIGSADQFDAQMETVLSAHPHELWAQCVYTIFTHSIPHVVPEDLYDDLVSIEFELNTKNKLEKMRDLLQNLPCDNLCILGKLCRMIQQCSVDPECTAMALAESVLRGSVDSKPLGGARRVMCTLVFNSAKLFEKEREHKAHQLSHLSTSIKGLTITDYDKLSPDEIEMRNSLRVFFTTVDPECVSIVDSLFDNYDFFDVALGIQRRYGWLPSKFDTIISESIKRNDEQASQLCQWWPANNWNGSSASACVKDYSIPSYPSKPSAVDQIIDEICISEERFCETMRDLLNLYVNKLISTANGSQGMTAREESGIAVEQVETIFGPRLLSVLEVSSAFAAQLSIVKILVTAPKHDSGRLCLLAQIFLGHAQNCNVFAQYNSSHMAALKQLNDCLISIEVKNDKENAVKPSTKSKKLSDENFDTMWQVCRQKSEKLQGQSLTSILITPVQRVPKYRIFLEALLKEAKKIFGPDTPAVMLTQEALGTISSVADKINTAVRRQNKLEKLFGQAHMINSSSSITQKNSGGVGGH